MAHVIKDSFKDNPILIVLDDRGNKVFRGGRTKARALVEAADQIRAFVDEPKAAKA